MSSRVLLVGLARSPHQRWIKADQLDELAQLVKTAGGSVVERIIQIRERPDAATLIGRGKALEISRLCTQYGIDLVVFEDLLSPTQLRNLEDIIGVRVIDREAVILDIFALHARTAEAKVQVELAQLEYIKTRLTGLGVELSRLGGGIGTRGPGETKLEMDRRRIEHRITVLRRELARIERERAVQRKRRSNLFQIVLAGYTNAGKSTIFNRLTSAGAKVSDQLFATLDANTRVWEIDSRLKTLVTDTVGFIRNLPVQLIASFRSTLSEVREADLIIHVADISDPQVEMCIDVVNETLTAIGAANNTRVLVFNKIDRVFDESIVNRLSSRYPDAVFLSALTGTGLDRLQERIRKVIEGHMVVRRFTLPVNRPDLVAMIRSAGRVLSEKFLNGRTQICVRGYPADLARIRKAIKKLL
ncbi:MAG: GTPase HflX [candidate division WOR-3 bacterium]|uniref:GTPase HflX n=1 Tax=candidate division WOR-3 bacterium TaxID=2052148 RepID=A0A7C3IXK8_UNCW3|nr:GTPase HflX [candidate division WOR-3 bacterium]